MDHKLNFAIATAGAVLGLTALHANPAQAAVIDFEEFEHGEVVTGVMTKHATLGVFSQGNVNQNFPNAGEPRDLMIFDTDCGPGVNCSADPDLDFGGQFGKALIISFDNNSAIPNDSQIGGVITFDFKTPVVFNGFNLLDDEEESTIVSLFNGNTLVQQIGGIVGPGDNSAIFVDGFTTAPVTRVEIDLPGSGAIDNVQFEKVPEPLTILGSTMALGFGALFKKQQSKKQKKN
ncbi:PEP-CTERM sorting domain-containing protein [Coleofasciculus sp. E2-BRE-01]|uniref:PEP-CTERM sorting domain-containing protein n=1 Tax=Coleofasciculus sp. E2-BRE-01 TaxID=3069524 RepID=UPI0032F64712